MLERSLVFYNTSVVGEQDEGKGRTVVVSLQSIIDYMHFEPALSLVMDTLSVLQFIILVDQDKVVGYLAAKEETDNLFRVDTRY